MDVRKVPWRQLMEKSIVPVEFDAPISGLLMRTLDL